jgi:hypothetical protein
MSVQIIDKVALTPEDKRNISLLNANSDRFCSGLVDKYYIKDSIDNSDYVVVSRDKNDGIKGFATLVHTPKLRKLFIDVICNVGVTKQTLRIPQVSSRGNEILDKIVEFGRDILKVSYLELHSLEHVITYYSKFGWKFLEVNKNNQCVQYKDYSQEIENLKNALKENNPWKITYRLNKFKDFKEGGRSDGYTMRFCLSPTIDSIVKRIIPATVSRSKTRRTPTISRPRTRKISRRPHTASRRTATRSRAGKTIR